MKKLISAALIGSVLLLAGCSQAYPKYDESNWIDFSSSAGFTLDATGLEMREGISDTAKNKINKAVEDIISTKSYAVLSSNSSVSSETLDGNTIMTKLGSDIFSSLQVDLLLQDPNNCNINSYQYVSSDYDFANDFSILYSDDIDFYGETYSQIITLDNTENGSSIYVTEFNEEGTLKNVSVLNSLVEYKEGNLAKFIKDNVNPSSIRKLYLTKINFTLEEGQSSFASQVLKIVGNNSYFVHTNNAPEVKPKARKDWNITEEYISEVSKVGNECVVGEKVKISQ